MAEANERSASTSGPRVHSWTVTGRFVRGEQRGRLSGYPTANLDLPPGMAIAEDGVYAGWAAKSPGSGHIWVTAVSVGTNPTFDGHRRTVDTLLDFDGDLYGKDLRASSLFRLRGMAQVAGVNEVVAAMDRDVAVAREVMAAVGTSRPESEQR